MKFTKPPASISFPEMEQGILKFWRENKIFEQSVSQRSPESSFLFYDGPPFATGLPHYGHLLAGTIKDVIPRFWAMRGRRVERRFGWDCHGLPVEFEMEKELNLKGRNDIIQFGVKQFNEACQSIVLRYTREWQEVVERMGRWIDFTNDYKTMDPAFMESVWAIFKRLWDRGLIYQDLKVLPYSTRISSPLSNFEANLNYQNVQDPSVIVRFPLIDQSHTSLLVWTTTPWTLPANLAVAVHPDFTYLKIQKHGDQQILIVLEQQKDAVLGNQAKSYEVLSKVPGRNLMGLRYRPVIPAFVQSLPDHAHRVVLDEFVASDSGTGLVHIAPAFGEDDYRIGKANALPPLDHLDEQGYFKAEAGLAQGQFFKEADKEVVQFLKQHGLLFKLDTVQHSYPFCYRTDTPLIYRAVSTWFLKVTQIRDQLVANNAQIHWVPEHLKEGRFGKWLEGAKDWAISRNRFWGNPIPVWKNEETGETICVGSRAELERLSNSKVHDLHKHVVDGILLPGATPGTVLTRVPHVLDCWFESGAMPYAQRHYPIEMDEQEFSKVFPADFIAEGLDQTRGWFYTLLVLSTALGKGAPFKHVVVNGIVLTESGQKMSKRLKNYPEPREVLDVLGADALRIYLLQSGGVRGEDLRFSEEGVRESVRQYLLPLWNAYVFLSTYAGVDAWDPEHQWVEKSEHNLDRWLCVKLERLKEQVTREMESYHLSKAVTPLFDFIDQLNNWYIRRSRRRFWKTLNDQDKFSAFSTLYTVLVETVKLVAPFTPFLAEYLYQQLRLSKTLTPCSSVHLADYPGFRMISEQEQLLEQQMDLARQIVGLGRELREKLKVKVRQPLASLFVGVAQAQHNESSEVIDIVKEELNVKSVQFVPANDIATWTIKPNFKILGKRLGSKMKSFAREVETFDEDKIAQLIAGQSIVCSGETVGESDFYIDLIPRPNFPHPCHAVAGLIVGIDDQLTEALVQEGLAREVVSRVQKMRKDSQLNVEDRIMLAVDSSDQQLIKSIQTYQIMIEQETLSTVAVSNIKLSTYQKQESIDDMLLSMGISLASQ